MKKILFIGTAVAIAMGFTSCQKENISCGQTEGQLVSETFTATLGQEATKTTISEDAATVTWAAGDQIHYYTKDGGTVRNFTIEAAGSSATLTLEREAGDTYYNLVYAGGSTPTFTTKTGTSMVFDGVKSAQDGTFANANVSVARTTPGVSSITFKPVVSIVKFTTARTDIKTIVLTGGNGEKVAGNISVDPTGDTPVATLSGTGEYSITVTIATPAAGTYYIGVIPHNYPNGLKMTLKNSSGTFIGTVTASKSTDLSAGDAMINYGNVDSHINTTVTVLDGRFSVGASKQVQFTRGNLYWDGSAWKFEGNQSEYPTTWSSNHVGHLYWTNLTDYQSGNASYMPYASSYLCSSQSTNDYFFCGEDNPLTVEGANGLFALSKDEWVYLLNISGSATGARQDANRFAKAMVNGKKGLVIFPDGYNGGVAISDIAGLATINNASEACPTTSIAAATWSTMESGGCVFLPIAGCWEENQIKYSDWGCYWSSTPNSNASQAYSLNIGDSQINQENNGKRLSGLSVRLVKECTPIYAEGTYTGKAIRVNDTWWAPVNCGYDATDYKVGKLYQFGRMDGGGYYSDGEAMVPAQDAEDKVIQTTTEATWPDGGYTLSPVCTIFYKTNIGDWYTQSGTQLSEWPMTAPSGTSRICNPCPKGWRVPTSDELGNLVYSDWNSGTQTGETKRPYTWDSVNHTGTINGLILPAAGFRTSNGGDANGRSSDGAYWSSSVQNTNAVSLYFTENTLELDDDSRASGFSVRCVQE